jgi:hypothetical protein
MSLPLVRIGVFAAANRTGVGAAEPPADDQPVDQPFEPIGPAGSVRDLFYVGAADVGTNTASIYKFRGTASSVVTSSWTIGYPAGETDDVALNSIIAYDNGLWAGFRLDKPNGIIAVPGESISQASYDGISFDIGNYEYQAEGMAFNPTGTRVFVVGGADDRVIQFTMEVPYDLSTAVFDDGFLLANQDNVPTDVEFNSNGSMMYILGADNDAIYQYNLLTPFDVSTAEYNDVSYDVSNQTQYSQTSITFDTFGTKLFLTETYDNNIYQYSLATPYDLSTMTYDNVNLYVGNQDYSLQKLRFTDDGLRMFMLGAGNNNIHEYILSESFNLATASYTQLSFSVSNQDYRVRGMAFNNSKTKLFVLGGGYDTIFQYSININPVFDVSASDYWTHYTPTGDLTTQFRASGVYNGNVAVALNGNIAVESNSTATIYDTNGNIKTSVNIATLLGTLSAKLASNTTEPANKHQFHNTFLFTGQSGGAGDVVLAEVSSTGTILRQVELLDVNFGSNGVYRYNSNIVIGESTNSTGSTEIVFINLATSKITRKTDIRTQLHAPYLEEVNSSYISYDQINEDNLAIVFGKLNRNSSVTPVILSDASSEMQANATLTAWTVYNEETIYWADNSGNAFKYSVPDGGSVSAQASSVTELGVHSANGTGNVAIIVGSDDTLVINETRIYDSASSVSLEAIVDFDLRYGNNRNNRSTIVPGAVPEVIDNQTITESSFQGGAGAGDGVVII